MSAGPAVAEPSVDEEYEALIQFMYLAPIGLLQARGDGEILMVNPLCAQLLMPLSSDGQMSNLYDALASVAPDLRSRVQGFAAPHGLVCEGLQLTLGGDAGAVGAAAPVTRKPRFLSLTLLKLDEERLMAVLGDVTQTVRRERELRQSQSWIHTLVAGLTDYALLTLDHEGRIREWNASVGRVTRHTAATTVGRSYAVLHPADAIDATGVLDRLREVDATGWSMEEGWRLRGDGSLFWGSCLIAPREPAAELPAEQRVYNLIVRDVSERREATESLRVALDCDHLTGLTNRRSFFETGEREVARWLRAPRPLSLLMIDADHFKRFNDRYGHHAGDAVLRHLAAGLTAAFRTRDTVARLGGEEFVVLLPGCDADAATAAAQRLCESLGGRGVSVDGALLTCTVSIGVAAMAVDVGDLDALLRRADAAMYAAKAAGRNRVQGWHAGLASTPVPVPTTTKDTMACPIG